MAESSDSEETASTLFLGRSVVINEEEAEAQQHNRGRLNSSPRVNYRKCLECLERAVNRLGVTTF